MLDGITPKKKVTLGPPKFDQKNGVLAPLSIFQSRHFPRYSANTFLTAFSWASSGSGHHRSGTSLSLSTYTPSLSSVHASIKKITITLW